MQGSEFVEIDPRPRRAPRVSYRTGDKAALLAEPGALALFGFVPDTALGPVTEPGYFPVALEALGDLQALELWQVDGPVERGTEGAVRWSAGAGWLFAGIELDERDHGGPAGAAQLAYEQLHRLVAARAEKHVIRIWNYLGAINQGEGDAERYKHFCDGRAVGMGDFFAEGFPAATGIGHLGDAHHLQVYLLACDQPGRAVENPRQVSAWRYPRQYGRTPPSFARAMTLPGHDALAISGTAAVVGHASAHQDDLDAQLNETLTNLQVLLDSAGMPSGFSTSDPLKVYLRHAADAGRVRAFLQEHLAGVPMVLLHGDICRSELLVEIDGWRYV